jgi:diadenylate cyclase
MQFARILWETLSSNWSWVSLLDVILVALGVYYLLLLVRGTRAIQLLKGVAVLLLLIAVTRALGLMTFNWLLSQALLPGVIALVILFQPELRLALERLGRGRLLVPSFASLASETVARVVEEIAAAARRLSHEKIGGLIVFERNVGLQDIIDTGMRLDAVVSAALLETIFTPDSPLHDRAVVIRGERIAAAGCLLPLTDRADVGVLLGTRHRAALGLSESTDALVIVVSEETGATSLTQEGRLFTNLSEEKLKQRLLDTLSPPQREPHHWFRRRSDAAAQRGA